MNKQEYGQLVKQTAAKSPVGKNCLFAFLIGGAICTVGQAVGELYRLLGVQSEIVQSLIPITMIFSGAFLTALGLYEKLARHAGAGTIIPITGFANSIVSPAIEFKTEGLVLGTSVKMFTVAGPVLVYGVTASVIYGLIAYALGVIV